MSATPEILATWLGRRDYLPTYDLQLRALARRKQTGTGDLVLMLEHEHVYTLGRRGKQDDILVDRAERQKLGVTLVETDRGGEATYHGPGQLVIYPILGIKRYGFGPLAYMRLLENVIMQTLAEYGLESQRMPGNPGVYVARQDALPVSAPTHAGVAKIAAVGVKISADVTMHGFSLNVNPDLTFFERIVPCGMPGLRVTSMALEGVADVSVEQVAESALKILVGKLGGRIKSVDPDSASIRQLTMGT